MEQLPHEKVMEEFKITETNQIINKKQKPIPIDLRYQIIRDFIKSYQEQYNFKFDESENNRVIRIQFNLVGFRNDFEATYKTGMVNFVKQELQKNNMDPADYNIFIVYTTEAHGANLTFRIP